MQIAENEFEMIYRKLSDHFSSNKYMYGAVEEQWYNSLRKFDIEPISNWKSMPEPDQYSCVAIFLDSNNILMSNPILGFLIQMGCPLIFWLKIPKETAEKILVLGL